MAVIIREDTEMMGKKFSGLITYRSKKLVTADAKKKAEELDDYLRNEMKKITRSLKEKGLLSLKGKKGKVLKLYHELGRLLGPVIDSEIVANQGEDKKWVWRALYDHAPELAPGPPPVRASDKTKLENSFFAYCYKIGKYPWDFVEKAGDWTAWSYFLDTNLSKDPRVMEWIGEKSKKVKHGKMNWVRNLNKVIIDMVTKKRDLSMIPDEELHKELEKVYSEAFKS